MFSLSRIRFLHRSLFFRGVVESLSTLPARDQFQYVGLVCLRSLTGILDVAGIALIGVLAGLTTGNKALEDSWAYSQLVSYAGDANVAIFVLGLIVLSLFLLKAIISIVLTHTIARFLARIESGKANQIVSYICSSDLEEVRNVTRGEISWAVTGSVTGAFTGLLTNFATVITEVTLLFLITVAFIWVDPIAAMAVFAYFGLVVMGVQLFVAKRQKSNAQKAATGNVAATESITEVLAAFREISVLGKQEYFAQKFMQARSPLSTSNAMINFYNGLPRYVIETALILGVVSFIAVQFFTNQLQAGLVVVGVFLSGGVRIMASLVPLQNAISNGRHNVIQAQEAMKLIAKSEEDSFGHALPDCDTSGVSRRNALGLVLNNVSFTYPGAAEPAISHVSLKVEPGEHVALIGPSGSGKSTIIDVVLGLHSKIEGSVLIGGMSPEELFHEAPGSVAYVPQKPGIISGTIAENVALGVDLDQIDERQLRKSLKDAQLWEWVESHPEGLDYPLGSHADSLSGGQIQRMGVARALYSKPKLLILDEATSALDASTENLITQVVRNLGSKITVVVVAHRLSTVQFSDKVVVIESGEITEQGTFKELLKRSELVANYTKLMSIDLD